MCMNYSYIRIYKDEIERGEKKNLIESHLRRYGYILYLFSSCKARTAQLWLCT